MPDRTRLRTTWDGLFISEEPPHGASVIVYRRGGPAGVEFLVLHRARSGDGDWAWGPPAGARLPGEPVEACARRELAEETGLSLAMCPLPHDPDWAAYSAEAAGDVSVVLSTEHDGYEWVALDEAVRRCLPARVGEQFGLLATSVAA